MFQKHLEQSLLKLSVECLNALVQMNESSRLRCSLPHKNVGHTFQEVLLLRQEIALWKLDLFCIFYTTPTVVGIVFLPLQYKIYQKSLQLVLDYNYMVRRRLQ